MKRLKQLMKTLKLKRNLTRREKILLTLFSTLICSWLAFTLIINPQYKKLHNLMEQKKDYQEKIENMNTKLKKEEEIYREWDSLYKERSEILKKYFSSIEQPQIIHILNGLLDNGEIEILDIKFERPYDEEIGESTVRAMDISIPYKGKYEELLDTVKKISSNKKNILISDLTIDGKDDGFITGDMGLKIYGLEDIPGIGREPVDVEVISDGKKKNPFEIFDNYIRVDDSDGENLDSRIENNGRSNFHQPNMGNNSGENNSFNYQANSSPRDLESKVLEDFEGDNFQFHSSQDLIQGSLSKSTNAKSGEHSLKLEYNIKSFKDINEIYIDLRDKNLILEPTPYTIGIWVYSYRYAPVRLNLQFQGQNGERIRGSLSNDIYWKGWKYLELIPPQDISLYPLKLENILLEVSNDQYKHGVILFDKLEVNYPKGDMSNNAKDYDFYIVGKGDSLDKISSKLYGTSDKKHLIIEHNDIKDEDDIKEGKILVIPR